MPEERLDAYLSAIDAAADWTPETGFDSHGNAVGFDEYNAWLIAVGRPAVTMTEYLRAIDPRRHPSAKENQ